MKFIHYKITLTVSLAIVLSFWGCHQGADDYQYVEPAHLEKIDGSELSKLKLTEKAVERLGVETAPVTLEVLEGGGPDERLVIPFAAVIYDAHAHVWVYTNPHPREYVRHEIKVDFIKGDKVVLFEGPPVGTQMVTVGAAELYGTEYEVGH